MKGDFSRLRFEKAKHYTSVLQQQGRVQLDADANEQRLIDEHLVRSQTVDIVGPDGAPYHDAGFAITMGAGNATLAIGPGRYYIDGLLCENDAALDYAKQPFLLHPTHAIAALLKQLQGNQISALQVWLEAWQRFVTPIDDPALREVALGEADTTARLQTVWRVVCEALKEETTERTRSLATNTPVDCCAAMRSQKPATAKPGMLTAQAAGTGDQGPCLPSPNASYRGLENQLYRVEIHKGGGAGIATFKWSRDNGSVVTGIKSISGTTVIVDSLGLDANLGFAAGHWTEALDDADAFGTVPNKPGTLASIVLTDPAQLQVTLSAAPTAKTANGHAKLRRWDNTTGTAEGIALHAGTWVDLENGVQVKFSADGTYETGDYWLIPARTATGDVEWPPVDSDGAASQPPHRLTVLRAPLACIHMQDTVFKIEDCRRIFRPLVELVPPEQASAIHVTQVSWKNDDVVTWDQVTTSGLSIAFDTLPDAPLTGGNVVVSLEIPIRRNLGTLPGNAVQFNQIAEQMAFVGENIAAQPSTPPGKSVEKRELIEKDVVEKQPEEAMVARETPGIFIFNDPASYARMVFVLDGTIKATAAKTVKWTIAEGVNRYIRPLLEEAAVLAHAGIYTRLRVALEGRTIFATANGNSAYLDGACFGLVTKRADGTSRMDLRFPSGNKEKASDFASWFYIAPQPVIVAFTLEPSAVVLPPSTSGKPTTATAKGTVTLNYAAPQPLQLAFTLPDKYQPVVTFKQPNVSVAIGASTVKVEIDILGATPGASIQVPLTATLTGPGGGHSVATAILTLSMASG